MKKLVLALSAACVGGLLFAAMITVPAVPAQPTDPSHSTAVEPLPAVGSTAQLRELLARSSGQPVYGWDAVTGAAPRGALGAAFSKAASNEVALPAAADFSGTNLQVAGVDEADLVKTDGKYIYQVGNSQVQIVEAYPVERMRVAATLKFEPAEFRPQEIYVDDRFLVLIGSGSREQPAAQPAPGIKDPALPGDKGQALAGAAALSSQGWPGNAAAAFDHPAPKAVPPAVSAPKSVPPAVSAPMAVPPELIYPPRVQTTKVVVYDLTSRSDPHKIREVELDGAYLSSRKVGSALYLVANKYIDLYRVQKESELQLPVYRDSAGSGEYSELDTQAIRYFPEALVPNYLLIGSFDLAKPEREAQIAAYLGGGNNVYCSLDNLYVAATEWENIAAESPVKPSGQVLPEPGKLPANGQASGSSGELVPAVAGAAVAVSAVMPPPSSHASTVVYKFELKDGAVRYSAKGKVPGTLLNQFSLDEFAGNFRLATTTGEAWRSDENTSRNNIYVLDPSLNVIGKLENLAMGEKIYAARFMGERAYLVTFRTVDPLFVIDLKSPSEPKVLGTLKIPGYSDYLQPYDTTHLLGFGKEAVEVTQSSAFQGQATLAFYLGMKIALFDVSDVAHPVEMYKETIGDRGTDSEVLRNHKALLFDRGQGLLAFPVTVAKVKGPAFVNGLPAYGEPDFQGAYVYRLDLQKGFDLRAKITHQDAAEQGNAGKKWMIDRGITRVLYIENVLYTLSPSLIKANSLSDFRELGSLSLPN